jgi:hypothetical protein
MEPAGQDPEAPSGARNGHTTALFTDESQSFLDNLIAGFAPSGSCNDPALGNRCSSGQKGPEAAGAYAETKWGRGTVSPSQC